MTALEGFTDPSPFAGRLFEKSLPHIVMARFNRAIHVFNLWLCRKDVDGRVKPGHDEIGFVAIRVTLADFSNSL
jgi:hypothetical protein